MIFNFFNRKTFVLLMTVNIVLVLVFSSPVEAFVQEYQYSDYSPAGVFSGVWHGLLAPYSLIARYFINDGAMYAIPNTGWFYDAGFLVGVAGSIPIGWAAAIISTILHILSL